MTLGQIVGLVIVVVVFVGLIYFQTWMDRRRQKRSGRSAPPPAAPGG